MEPQVALVSHAVTGASWPLLNGGDEVGIIRERASNYRKACPSRLSSSSPALGWMAALLWWEEPAMKSKRIATAISRVSDAIRTFWQSSLPCKEMAAGVCAHEFSSRSGELVSGHAPVVTRVSPSAACPALNRCIRARTTGHDAAAYFFSRRARRSSTMALALSRVMPQGSQ